MKKVKVLIVAAILMALGNSLNAQSVKEVKNLNYDKGYNFDTARHTTHKAADNIGITLPTAFLMAITFGTSCFIYNACGHNGFK